MKTRRLYVEIEYLADEHEELMESLAGWKALLSQGRHSAFLGNWCEMCDHRTKRGLEFLADVPIPPTNGPPAWEAMTELAGQIGEQILPHGGAVVIVKIEPEAHKAPVMGAAIFAPECPADYLAVLGGAFVFQAMLANQLAAEFGIPAVEVNADAQRVASKFIRSRGADINVKIVDPPKPPPSTTGG